MRDADGWLRIDGQAVVVTGAGSGIGRECAIRLARQGASQVVLVDVDAEALQGVVERVKEAGSVALPSIGDVATRESVKQAWGVICARSLRPSILVNAAGNASSSKLEDLDAQEWSRTIGSHLTGTYNWCQTVLPGMIEMGRGSIVNIASIAGKRGGGFLGTAAYCAAKAAIIGLTKAVAKEAGPHGIRVNSVSPGVTLTPRVAGLMADEAKWGACVAAAPLKRAAEPGEVAALVGFLASGGSSFICGENLNIDGGVMME